MTYLTAESAQQIEESLDELYAELAADSHRDGPRCLMLTTAEKALSTIRAAKAQADHIADADKMVREPVATLHDDGCFTWKSDEFRLLYDRQRAGWRMDVYAAPVEPAKQEPVAWMCWTDSDEEMNPAKAQLTSYEPKAYAKRKPLYTTPIRTKYLTDFEIDCIRFNLESGKTWIDFARAVIAKFKEKNK